MVEVDSSYYAIPAPQTAQLWAERTPRDFTFNVKAFRALTGHPFQAKVLPKDLQLALGAGAENLYYKDLPAELQTALWDLFFAAVEPLRLNGKLGAIHFQFRTLGDLGRPSAQARRTLCKQDGRAGTDGGGVSQCLVVDRAQSRLHARVRTRAGLVNV
jgi:uncharacterized protein YecE (DUF72 family)